MELSIEQIIEQEASKLRGKGRVLDFDFLCFLDSFSRNWRIRKLGFHVGLFCLPFYYCYCCCVYGFVCVCTSVEWEGVNRYPFILNKSLIASQKKIHYHSAWWANEFIG